LRRKGRLLSEIGYLPGTQRVREASGRAHATEEQRRHLAIPVAKPQGQDRTIRGG